MTRVRREHEIAQFDSGHPDLRPGVVTEACRSDTAAGPPLFAAVPGSTPPRATPRWQKETRNDDSTIETPASERFRGRGVKAAQQTFNLAGEGSIPSGPIGTKRLERRTARSSTVRAGSL